MNNPKLNAYRVEEAFSLPQGERQSEGALKDCVRLHPYPNPLPEGEGVGSMFNLVTLAF